MEISVFYGGCAPWEWGFQLEASLWPKVRRLSEPDQCRHSEPSASPRTFILPSRPTPSTLRLDKENKSFTPHLSAQKMLNVQIFWEPEHLWPRSVWVWACIVDSSAFCHLWPLKCTYNPVWAFTNGNKVPVKKGDLSFAPSCPALL